jgi:CHAD domain-containing protein
MTEPTSSTEVERKLTVPPDFSLEHVVHSLAALAPVTEVRAERRRNLVAVYYDTDDFRLSRSQITLRRRTGGPDSGWHLKLPSEGSNGDGTTEIAMPLRAGRHGQVPTALADLVVAVTGTGPLVPLARQETTRVPLTVIADGDKAVELVDDTVVITDGAQAGVSYREVEVEVLDRPELLEPVVGVLAEAGAERSSSKSKGIRALVGDTPLQPLVDPGSRPKPKDPAADAVAYHVRVQVAAILEQDLRIRRHLPDAVHQYRVAARRLRSVLQAFAPLVDATWGSHLRTELGWIAATLSQSRDREVLEERLIDAVRALPTEVDGAAALVLVRRHLEDELVEANATMADAMRSRRYKDLIAVLTQATVIAPTTPLAEGKSSKVLPPLVEARWRKLDKQGRRLHDELEGHDDHWHRTRIDAKKARYTVEACIPVFGDPAKKFARQLEAVTELLGEHQDAAIAASLMQQLSSKARGARAAFALGVLYEQQRAHVRRCRQEFVEAWPRVSHAGWRSWLEPKPK